MTLQIFCNRYSKKLKVYLSHKILNGNLIMADLGMNSFCMAKYIIFFMSLTFGHILIYIAHSRNIFGI